MCLHICDLRIHTVTHVCTYVRCASFTCVTCIIHTGEGGGGGKQKQQGESHKGTAGWSRKEGGDIGV